MADEQAQELTHWEQMYLQLDDKNKKVVDACCRRLAGMLEVHGAAAAFAIFKTAEECEQGLKEAAVEEHLQGMGYGTVSQ